MPTPHILYGMAGSLYSAKVRAYLRQNHIPFEERKAGDARFAAEVIPKTHRWMIPVIETPGGELLQDGTDILDHFEDAGKSKHSIYPDTPVIRIIAHLFELFGNEGMLRPAMHYRWNFDDVNLAFVRDLFRDALPSGLDAEQEAAAFDFASGRMRQAAGIFGVAPETFAAIEESHQDFLARYNAHLSQNPYLLGGAATIGDFALLGPLYAHMGRDPAPLHLMQTTAPRVFRWTERMNRPEMFVDEVMAKADGKSLADDSIPDTLKSLMQFIAEDYLPEITAHVAFANDWLAEHPDIEPGTNGTDDPATRFIGMAAFNWRGHDIKTAVMLYRFYLLQRLQDAFDAADKDAQKTARALFAECGLEAILDLKTTRRVERKDYLEVWA